ncbi:uncharacterized protein LOC123699057 [Colias croceus]|uniref:uncharacterized protein LOC123699057 n=1 Tax=Colias crocea TaxID=72248 RepID=UPI001E27F72D|nr:uncharacterized protein LOC123699057 [Colias croceus]
MYEDSLIFLPVERWRDLMNEFKNLFPRGISGYTTLDIELCILENGVEYGFKVYCPYGDLSNGFVGINKKAEFNEVIIQSPKDDTSELIKALKETKIINWKQSLEIPFAPQHIKNVLLAIQSEKNFEFTSITSTETFYLENNAPIYDITLPPGFSFKLLPIEYVKLVDDVWPHRYPSSVWYFELLIKAKLGYGLFNNNELIAWCFVKEMGALGHLYTLEQHRRKGYGEMVLKLMSNRLREEGKQVVAFCVVGNQSARNMYVKLGFSLTETVHWCNIKPISND